MSSYQYSAQPQTVPASPVFTPGSSSFGGSQASSGNSGASNSQIPPLPIGSDGQELEMINAKVTPYPGYVAPPPAPDFPTLIENTDSSPDEENPETVQANLVSQQGSQTLKSSKPLDLLPAAQSTSDYSSCPAELTTLNSFLMCIKRLAPMATDEKVSTCTFDQTSSCRFQSIAAPLSVGSLPSPAHYRNFAAISSRQENMPPQDNFVFLVEYRGARAEDEFMLSTSIRCQKGNGILKFDYWILGNPNDVIMRVCTSDSTSRSCTQAIVYTASPTVTVEVVNPNTTVFDVQIVASNLISPTVITFDNLIYQADLCDAEKGEKNEDSEAVNSFFDETVGDAQEEPRDELKPIFIPARPKNRPAVDNALEDQENRESEEADEEASEDVRSQSSEGKSLCELLNCDFDKDLCSYSNYENETMSLSNWQIGNHRVGNPHTGVRDQTGGFLYVGTDSRQQKLVNYILESANITVEEDFQLSLDVYRRSNDITLQVCLDSPFYCPYSVSPFQKEVYWKEGELFLIPKGTTKIYLRAIQWKRFKWLAIDNLKANMARGNESALRSSDVRVVKELDLKSNGHCPRRMSPYNYKTLKVEKVADFVIRVALNRPRVLNAMDTELWGEIGDVFLKLDEDPDCRVVILEAEGAHFCAGLDLTNGALAGLSNVEEGEDVARKARKIMRMAKWMQQQFVNIQKCSKPVIAAVHGVCYGAGVDVIASCDIRHATRDARFCVKEVDVGLAADVGSLNLLPKICGNESWLKEICISARPFDAEEALRFDVLNKIYETREEMQREVRKLASLIASKTPVATQGTKIVLNYARDNTAAWNGSQIMTGDIQSSGLAVLSKQPHPPFSKL
ncbi:unnamed protein product [Caenorhabditis auriculariae]|uniref:Uncharacterized protein n=1 Tax=Caenorhabditis auriculariae TaxID=2777116 RepID=A0A8S1H2G7_9PELO|nr:unnamed protein product [Caenorhabditis auriculariae]